MPSPRLQWTFLTKSVGQFFTFPYLFFVEHCPTLVVALPPFAVEQTCEKPCNRLYKVSCTFQGPLKMVASLKSSGHF